MLESGYRKEQNFLGFFRETEEYGFLSNFYYSPFTGSYLNEDGVKSYEFKTAEHAVHFFKAMLFNDIETANKIMMTEYPKVTKNLGRTVKNFNQNIWDLNKRAIYTEVIKAKFTDERNSDIKQKLLDTKEYVLVECSPYDRIWGIGYTKESSEFICKEFDKWGQNLLGKILMRVRDNIR